MSQTIELTSNNLKRKAPSHLLTMKTLKHKAHLGWKHYRSELLTGALIASMIAVPLDDRSAHFGAFEALLQFVLLFAGASSMTSRTYLRYALTPVAGMWLIARILEGLLPSPNIFSQISPITGLMLSCTILIGLFRRFKSIAQVTTGIIAESILTYLVIAIAFAQLYWILDRYVGSIFDASLSLHYQSAFLYFSMVTLSGLGYTATLPTAHFVQLISAFENMIGLFYIALVVSRLVSAYQIKAEKQEERLLRRIEELVSVARPQP